MILIGVGSNVPGPWGTPEETVARVGFELGRGPVRVERVSRPVRTTPFGVTEQPPFTNAALAIETDLPPRLGCFIFRRWSGGLAATRLRLKDDGVPWPLFSSATAARSAMDERERLSATERACRVAVAHCQRVWPGLRTLSLVATGSERTQQEYANFTSRTVRQATRGHTAPLLGQPTPAHGGLVSRAY